MLALVADNESEEKELIKIESRHTLKKIWREWIERKIFWMLIREKIIDN